MKNKLIIANWKAYNYIDLTIASEMLHALENLENVIVAPAMIYLALIKEKFPNIKIAAQDISSVAKDYGAYTGETPAAMLETLGVEYVIIGHSERRQSGLDDYKSINSKISNALAHNITPIICIGETKEERQSGNYLESLRLELSKLEINKAKEVIIAYEPVWAIGTGIVPRIDEISEVISLIGSTLKIAGKLKLVYGGSVGANNFEKISEIAGLDGIFVGKASMDPVQFKEIIDLKKP